MLVIVACVVGWLGNKGVAREFDDIVDALEETIGTVAAKGESIGDTMWSTANSAAVTQKNDLREYSSKIKKESNQMKEVVENSRKEVNNLGKLRTSALNYSFILAIALIAIGLLASVFNMSALAMLMCILAFLCLIIAWISVGVHLGTAVLLDDSCYEIDLYVSDPNQRMFEPFQKIIKCPDGTEFTEGYGTMFMTLTSLTTKLNSNLEKIDMPTIAPRNSLGFHALKLNMCVCVQKARTISFLEKSTMNCARQSILFSFDLMQLNQNSKRCLLTQMPHAGKSQYLRLHSSPRFALFRPPQGILASSIRAILSSFSLERCMMLSVKTCSSTSIQCMQHTH